MIVVVLRIVIVLATGIFACIGEFLSRQYLHRRLYW
jgi:uncharacterized protein YneF (UPF0154 family)